MLERFFRARGDFFFRQFADAQRESHVFVNRQVRPDGKRLEHHAEIAMLGRQIEFFPLRRNELVFDPDFSVVEILEAGDHAQRRRFAAAGRAKHGDAFALRDVQIQAVDRRDLAETFGDLP